MLFYISNVNLFFLNVPFLIPSKNIRKPKPKPKTKPKVL